MWYIERSAWLIMVLTQKTYFLGLMWPGGAYHTANAHSQVCSHRDAYMNDNTTYLKSSRTSLFSVISFLSGSGSGSGTRGSSGSAVMSPAWFMKLLRNWLIYTGKWVTAKQHWKHWYCKDKSILFAGELFVPAGNKCFAASTCKSGAIWHEPPGRSTKRDHKLTQSQGTTNHQV